MLNVLQVVVWEEPALLAIRHLSVLHKESGVVMKDGDMGDKRVLRTTVRSHVEASSRINRIAYFSILERQSLRLLH